MRLPFTTAQFFDAFARYNEAVWPAPLVLTALAVAAVAAVTWPRRRADPFVAAVLALLWAWTGLVYHLTFFARINPLAPVFAALSLLGAGAFLWWGVVAGRLRFRPASRAWAACGYLLQGYALIVYPALSAATGHAYPAMPTFGLPCPTTLFTAGTLAFLEPGHPKGVLVVPLLWSLVGVQAAFLLGVPQDLALFVAAAACGALLLRRG